MDVDVGDRSYILSGKLNFIILYSHGTNMQLVNSGVDYTGTSCTNLVPSLFLFPLLFYFPVCCMFSHFLLKYGYTFPLSLLCYSSFPPHYTCLFIFSLFISIISFNPVPSLYRMLFHSYLLLLSLLASRFGCMGKQRYTCW